MTAKGQARQPAERQNARATVKAPRAPASSPEVIRISSDDVDESRVPLFYIDGTEYTMLANPSASLALEYLDFAKSGDQEAAQVFMMTEMIGEDGWQALKGCRALKGADLRRVMQVVNKTLMGALETPKD
jgi:hypothetical protein